MKHSGSMILDNPYPETCCFAVEKKGIHLAGIHPKEVLIGNAFLSASRRADFFSGRRCAHRAMASAGYPPLPILLDRNRYPIWPLNVVGSITHGASMAAAVVARRHHRLWGLGIDIEDLLREMRTDISRHVLTPWEIEHWQAADRFVSTETRLIFSIKESIYKCFFPLQNVRLGFQDAEVIEIDSTRFSARLLRNPFRFPIRLPLMLEGRLQYSESFVFSALQFDPRQIHPLK